MVTCSSRSEHIADYQLISFLQESNITQRMMTVEFGELSVNKYIMIHVKNTDCFHGNRDHTFYTIHQIISKPLP